MPAALCPRSLPAYRCRAGRRSRASARLRPPHPEQIVSSGLQNYLVQRSIEPLVVERAGHGRELGAEILGLSLDEVVVVGCAVGPGLDYGEVVGPVGLLEYVEAQIAGLLAAVLGELLDRRDTVVLLWRDDVDVSNSGNSC